MTRSHRRSSFVVVSVLLASALGMYARADKEPDPKPISCIMVNSIERDEAANERTVVFFMRGKSKMIYRNDMRSTCAFLKRGETDLDYHYNSQSVKLTRLCDYDGITVHNATQITCALGQFTPITSDAASALLGHPVGTDDAAAQPAAKKTSGDSVGKASDHGADEAKKK